MAFYGLNPDLLAQCATKFAQAEQKFTNEQLEYLRQYYTVNKYPLSHDFQAIAKQWNIDDFHFNISLDYWFLGRRMAEQEIVERRDQGRIAAA
ncbi:unnamed protein product [Rotaria sordida]|uniref:Homeobox domain-containing protein n=1 Tax=Rotaria sordida TaxID=392033 RepID=A0A814A5J1_9BILA|nr:unnamed protein product [Rotaria sordida]CAF1085748.1 unnamed protein product [Rotaria sordida]